MHQKTLVVIFYLIVATCGAQTEPSSKDSTKIAQDSLRKALFIGKIGNGYLPFKYFDLDLRYLLKFNQYEGLRTGLGGITNENFSSKLRLNTYLVYGFRDERYKYSFGASFKLSDKTDTWLNTAYTDDLQETGSSVFLTDKRFFSFFEPRLLNIDLFHRHITKTLSLEHKMSQHLLSVTQLDISKITPTYSYDYLLDGVSYNSYDISSAKVSLQWSPFSNFEEVDGEFIVIKDAFPKFTLQYTQSFRSVLNGDFNFTKVDVRATHEINYKNRDVTTITIVGGLALGDTPLTHLYHAYPNNINKETIMNRFSVAGFNSFETMFFNEFFSDRLTTLQLKHFFKPFEITDRFKPQLVLIARYALGNMSNIDRHQGITFNTLEHLYSESGLEINKLIFGFGLSFAYRYGSYHLPVIEDNIAFKFTFNLSI